MAFAARAYDKAKKYFDLLPPELKERLLARIDKVDAALCALAAHRFLRCDFKTYGESATGFIVVPAHALLS